MVPDDIANVIVSGSDSHLPLQTTSSQELQPPVRTDKGQFPKGVSGNPAGRPAGRKNQITALKQDMELAIRQHVRADKIKKIVEKMANKAANGNVAAAKLILDHFLSKVTDTEDTADKSGGLTIRIENATFAANQSKQSHKIIVATEGEFTEVKK
jgi:hypothetical protein